VIALPIAFSGRVVGRHATLSDRQRRPRRPAGGPSSIPLPAKPTCRGG